MAISSLRPGGRTLIGGHIFVTYGDVGATSFLREHLHPGLLLVEIVIIQFLYAHFHRGAPCF